MKLTAVVLAAAISLLAQNTGGLKGVITDQSGALVAGAQVTLTDPNGTPRIATTDDRGAYAVNGLTPGIYT
ncbi:MAG: carboxypeptidase-like regulatory domain-containing protein, partial [Bryobacteraceae bacterium]